VPSFTRYQLASRWQRGECDIYARALVREYPHLRFGVALTRCEDVCHFFAHDDTTAYDSLGAHPLPYLGADGRFDHAATDIGPGAWGLDSAIVPVVRKALREALVHIRRHRTGPRPESSVASAVDGQEG
jgi:hypothetical protein